ncbi:MAG: PAS domain S-box protein, partial [Pseudomonadota bacterium]
MTRPRILIVEDQLIVAEDLSCALDEAGYEVIGICDTGEGAIESAGEGAPDLVLMDIRLRGEMDGIEAAGAIRSLRDTAIVYLTAHSEKSLFERAKQTEPDGYLYKPVSEVELARTVEMVLYRRQMEKKLRESEQRYRSLVETGFDGILVLLGSEITYANGRLHEMLGYDGDSLIGKNHLTLYTSDSQPLVREIAEAVAGDKGLADRYEITLQSRNGSLVEAEIRAKKVVSEGEPGIQFWIRDVSEQKRAYGRLKLLGDAIEQSREGVAVADMEGNLVFLNHAFASMHGFEREELMGKHLSVFHTQDQIPAVEAAVGTTKDMGGFSGEIWHVRRDGTVFPTLMHNSLFRDGRGNACGLLGTVRDITDIKESQESLDHER